MLLLIASCVALLLIDTSTPDETWTSPPGNTADPVHSEQGYMLTRWSEGLTVESAAVADDGEALYGDIGGGTVCTFDGDGFMVADSTVASESDLHDSREHEALALTGDGMDLIDLDNEQIKHWHAPDAVDGALRNDGAVALTADALVWFGAGAAEASRTSLACTDLSFDREADSAWLACGDVVRGEGVDRAVQFPVEGGASAVAWSPELQAIFVVDGEGTMLTAVSPAGAVLWKASLPGTAKGLVALGDSDVAAVLVRHAGKSELVLYGGQAGQIMDRAPVVGGRLSGAHDAPVLALAGSDGVSLIDVEFSE